VRPRISCARETNGIRERLENGPRSRARVQKRRRSRQS
jgi:hypothetical protein